MELVVKRFAELTADELYEILRLRVDVFVVEQKCPYPEIDGRDRAAFHVWLRDENGIQAYLRVLEAGVSFPEVSIGRVVVRTRRRGLGTPILHAGLDVAAGRLHARRIRIEAQTYARSLYEKAGFRQDSAEFLEDGIPHIQMVCELP